MKEKIIGIDLGTTNSCMAVMEGGKPVIIPNAEGGRTTPSVVGFAKDGTRLVGQVAKRQAVSNIERTISSVKRKMGTDWNKKIDDKKYTATEISAMVLQKMKTDAEKYLGHEVKKAVITVPAYFNDNQRQATKDAGTIAGFEVMRIINEPTASSLAYGLEREEGEKILIYDLGGGTFDISILEVGDGVFEVLGTDGDTDLGGDDWDQRIIDWMAAEFKRDQGVDLSKDPTAMQRLKEAAEKAKIELSGLPSTNINLPYITADQGGPKHLDLTLSRAKFEELTADLLERTKKPIKSALKLAKMAPKEISKVILVGGSTRMPVVLQFIKQYFGKAAYQNINPDECLAIGAAIQGGRATSRRAPSSYWTSHRSPWASRPLAAYPRGSSNATPPSQRARARSSPRPRTCRPLWRSTSYRASATWPMTTSPSAGSTWWASRPHPGACHRSRWPSTSTPAVS